LLDRGAGNTLDASIKKRVRVVHLGRSTCHAISGRGNQSTRIPHLLLYSQRDASTNPHAWINSRFSDVGFALTDPPKMDGCNLRSLNLGAKSTFGKRSRIAHWSNREGWWLFASMEERPVYGILDHTYLTECIYLLVLESQLPHKTVNLIF